MKRTPALPAIVLLAVIITVLSSFLAGPFNRAPLPFPYKQAGLTDRQAAAHLLNRLTYGARPGDIDRVINIGLEKWFEQQLEGGLPDDSLQRVLSAYSWLTMSNAEIVNTYPRPGKVVRTAVKEGLISKDSLNKTDKKEYREQLRLIMEQNNQRPQQELFRQLVNQKIMRAAVTNNQLHEVLTDFWFNHFNVSITKNDCAAYIPAYERDVIRPNVVGKFSNLLLQTAKSPAMLLYLDNFSSAGNNADMSKPGNEMIGRRLLARRAAQAGDTAARGNFIRKAQQVKKAQGLNENYAREVMELHTLGVDGGYTQQDVTQAARVLTGWTIYPTEDYGSVAPIRRMIDKIGEDQLARAGFVHDGDFLFTMNRHDQGEKVVLGRKFNRGGGYEEGVELLHMLADHPSTARFISRKLAVRFVSDNPPQALVDKMAKTFTEKKGNIRDVLITMVSSPEFWSKESLREKTKSPFELAMSSVRSLNASVTQPYQLYTWINKMGQKMYYYQAPTGFPDKGQYWINTGALLNRMNFGLALAAERIPGVKVDLLSLNNNHEPESADVALALYSRLMLPERELSQTLKRLTPMLNDPALNARVEQAAVKTAPLRDAAAGTDMIGSENMQDDIMLSDGKAVAKKQRQQARLSSNVAIAKNPMLGQVVGIIIGSPEFQRR